jgi:hypothetical protein
MKITDLTKNHRSLQRRVLMSLTEAISAPFRMTEDQLNYEAKEPGKYKIKIKGGKMISEDSPVVRVTVLVPDGEGVKVGDLVYTPWYRFLAIRSGAGRADFSLRPAKVSKVFKFSVTFENSMDSFQKGILLPDQSYKTLSKVYDVLERNDDFKVQYNNIFRSNEDNERGDDTGQFIWLSLSVYQK